MPHAPASPRFVHTPFFTVKAAARFHHPWPAHQVAQCFSLSCLKKKISCKGANVLRVPLWPLTCMAHFWWQPRSVRTVMCFCHSRKHLPLLLSCKTQRAFCLPPVPPPHCSFLVQHSLLLPLSATIPVKGIWWATFHKFQVSLVKSLVGNHLCSLTLQSFQM